MSVKVYLNYPGGMRWKVVEDAVASLRNDYGIEVEVIRSNEVPFLKRLLMPGFPAVQKDGRFVVRDRVVTVQELKKIVEGGGNE